MEYSENLKLHFEYEFQKNFKKLPWKENWEYFESDSDLKEWGIMDWRYFKHTYNGSGVATLQEEKTKEGKNVFAAYIDGHKIGIIKRFAHIKKLMREDNIKYIKAEVYGGKYKSVHEYFDYDEMEDVCEVEHGDFMYQAKLTLFYKRPISK